MHRRRASALCLRRRRRRRDLHSLKVAPLRLELKYLHLELRELARELRGVLHELLFQSLHAGLRDFKLIRYFSQTLKFSNL